MMMKSGFWKDLLDRAKGSPYLLLLFIASVLLSIASFYTTFVGLTPFVAHWIFAFFITAAIQSLLFVVSWRLGFMLADKESVAKIDVGVFVVCFTLSVFFSFNSLFNVMFGEERQQEASLGRARDGAVEVVNDAEQRLKSQLDQELRAIQKGNAAANPYLRWREQINRAAELALQTGPDLRLLLEEQRAQAQQDLEQRQQQTVAIVAEKSALDDEMRRLRERLAAAEQTRGSMEELTELRAEVNRLKLAVKRKEAEMKNEEGGVGETGKSGRGPVWTGLKQQRDRLAAELQIMQDELAGKEGLGRDLAGQLSAAELRLASVEQEIDRAKNRERESRLRLEGFGAGGTVEETVQSLRDYPSRFETTADPANLEQAETLCNQLADNMRTLPEPPEDLYRLSCDRGPIQAKVAAVVASGQALAAVDAHCTGADAQSLHELALVPALDRARECLDLTRLPFKRVRDLRDKLDRLQREEGPNASEFTRTTNALFAWEKDAMFALVIAISMDLLVLFTGLIGAKSAKASFNTRVLEVDRRDAADVVAIKSLIKHLDAHDEKIQGTRYEGRIDLNDIPTARARELVDQLLVRNAASGLVKPSNDPDVYFLRHGAIQQLEDQLVRLQQMGSQAPAAAQPSFGRPAAASTDGPTIHVGGGFRLFGSQAPRPMRRSTAPAAGSTPTGAGTARYRTAEGIATGTGHSATRERPAAARAGAAGAGFAEAPGTPGYGTARVTPREAVPAEVTADPAGSAPAPATLVAPAVAVGAPAAGAPEQAEGVDAGRNARAPAPREPASEGSTATEEDLDLVFQMFMDNEPGTDDSTKGKG